MVGVVIFELIARLTKIPSVVVRKVIHVGMALLSIGVSFVFDYHVMIWVGSVFALLFLGARSVYQFRSLRDRKAESWGEIFFPLGIAVSAAIAPTQSIFIAALLTLALSDTVAFIVGKHFTRAWRIIEGRTVAGSGAGFLVTLLVTTGCGFGILEALTTTAAVTVAEIFSKRGADNFTMPVIAAIILTLWVTL